MSKDSAHFLEPSLRCKLHLAIRGCRQVVVHVKCRHRSHRLLEYAPENVQFAITWALQHRATLTRLRNPVCCLYFLADEQRLELLLFAAKLNLLKALESRKVNAEMHQ